MLSAEQLQPIAAQQVFIGTSSWKYPGRCGQLYNEQRELTCDPARFPRHRKAAPASIRR
ncbi:MAG: hypothetical protein WCK55_20315 [Verrucomicrobiota bacterium]